MKIVTLFALVTTCSAAIFSAKLQHHGSLRAQLIRDGKYEDFLAQKERARINVPKRNQFNSGREPLMDWSDRVYTMNITIGTPPQHFTVSPKTGEANLWVVDTSCTVNACTGDYNGVSYKKNRFSTSRSSTFKHGYPNNTFWWCGSGNCTGFAGRDTVSFAGMTIPIQTFALANYVRPAIGYQPYDGVLGLGWPALAFDNMLPPMWNLFSQLDAPIFTVWLDRHPSGSYGGIGGLITFGGIDNVNCDAEINYVPLTVKANWQFQMEGFAIGNFSENSKNDAFTDTGSSWLGVPENIISAVLKQTHGFYYFTHDIYVVSCSSIPTQPDMIFTIGGKKYTIPPTQYIQDVGDGACALSFFAWGSGGFGPTWTLGDVFINSYCNIHDIGKGRIGFAKAHHKYINSSLA